MAPEQVGGAVELVEGKRAGAFEAEQLEGGGAGVEPVAGGALGGGLEHAGEDEGGGDAGVAGGGAGGFESVAESELVEGVEGEALGADGADVGVVEGIEVNGGEVVAGMEGAALEEAAVDALGEGEQWGVGRFEGKLGGIAVEDELDELGPALGRDIKVGTEVEEVDLAGAGVRADIADEAEGGVGAAGGAVAGSDLADEHGPSMEGGGRRWEHRNWTANRNYVTTSGSAGEQKLQDIENKGLVNFRRSLWGANRPILARQWRTQVARFSNPFRYAGSFTAGASTFISRAESLRAGDFTGSEVRPLPVQHTAATGQEFEEGTLARGWPRILGQPWLMNALAIQACFKQKSGRNRIQAIDADAIDGAIGTIISDRVTHRSSGLPSVAQQAA